MENFTRGLESIKKKSDGNLELKITERASLVVQWLRIYLAMQGHQFDPWSRKGWGPMRVVRKLRDGVVQLSPWAETAEALAPRVTRSKEKPREATTIRRPHTATKTHHSQKQNK